MNGPLVSVIIMFLDAKRFLKEAVESVFTQTYGSWELILVDDGSTDGSTEIARYYAGKFPERVRYVEHEKHQNRGMSASRNAGIAEAKGKYIALLDSDDTWFPDKLAEQISILEGLSEDVFLYGRTLYWRSWQDGSTRDEYSQLQVPHGSILKPPLMLRLYLKGRITSPSFSNVMFSKQLAERVGGFEDSFHGMYEDQAFLMKVFLNESVYLSDQVWDRYREHADSCVSQWIRSGKSQPAYFSFLEWFEQYLLKNNLKESEFSELLQLKLRPFRHPLLYQMEKQTKRLARSLLPEAVLRKLRSSRTSREKVRLGDLRRTTPISRGWGVARGSPVDRYYIDKFLNDCKSDIHGHVLEVQDDRYTVRFGADRVQKSEILDLNPANIKATIIADLTDAPGIPSTTFDCVILTQTLQLIYDTKAVLQTVYRILKPGGTVLATFPGITNTPGSDSWYWSFTKLSAARLFREVFSAENVEVRTYGNVLSCVAFLEGLCVEDLTMQELDQNDPEYQLLVAVRAIK